MSAQRWEGERKKARAAERVRKRKIVSARESVRGRKHGGRGEKINEKKISKTRKNKQKEINKKLE